MRLVDFIGPEDVLPDMTASSKNEALAELAAWIAARHALDRQTVLEVLWERESLASTGIGDGIAIPHGKLAQAPRLCAAFGRSRAGVEFESADGQCAHLFLALLAPESSTGLHLKALARVSRLLKDGDLRRRLIEADSTMDMYQLLCEEDSKHSS